MDKASGLRYFGHASWGMGHDLAVFCGLLHLEKLPQRPHVVLELGCLCLAGFVDRFDNRIFPHGSALKFF
jgi:hypothetical protein